MKKIGLLFCIIWIVLPPLIAEDGESLRLNSEVTINRDGVNARGDWNLNSAVLAVLPLGTEGVISDISSTKESIGSWGSHYWYEMEVQEGGEYSGMTLWVFGAFLDRSGYSPLPLLNRHNQNNWGEWLLSFFAMAEMEQLTVTGLDRIQSELAILKELNILDDMFLFTLVSMRSEFDGYGVNYFHDFEESLHEPDILLWFVEAGANPDFTANIPMNPIYSLPLSPLGLALEYNDISLVSAILEAGIEVSVDDLSSALNNIELFDLFLSHGGDIDGYMRFIAGDGDYYEESKTTLLHGKSSSGDLEDLTLLLERGADPEINSIFTSSVWVTEYIDGKNMLEALDGESYVMDFMDMYMNIEVNPLAVAIIKDNQGVVDLLQSYGADEYLWQKKITSYDDGYLRVDTLIFIDGQPMVNCEERFFATEEDRWIESDIMLSLQEYKSIYHSFFY